MKAALTLLLILCAASSAFARLGKAREFLRQNEPAKAGEFIAGMLAKTPDDPWLLYNAGVAAYAAKDYAKADAFWQKLASMEMPEKLRDLVWLQIGNASFRMVEPALVQQPDSAVAKLEQSREAYRIAIAQNPESETAPKNLVFVEKQLENVYVRLAARLVADAKKERAAERAIEKLHAALNHQRSATSFNPEDPRHTKAEHDIKQLLAEKFVEKAGESEKRGDKIAEQKSLDQQKRDAAKQEFEKAIADFKQAQTFDAEKSEAKDGEKRVIDKLANMHAKAGRQEQKEGNAEAKENAEQAMASYERALGYFADALAVKADHKDALEGRDEVKKAMEKLHLEQGDRKAKAGEEQIKKSPAEAVENLLGALDHFEQAKTLNPDNPTIPPRIEHVQKLLPDVLVALGQNEQEQAKKEEPSSIPNAIAHLERAEVIYEKALQLDPSHQAAKEGLQQVREDLERLRKQLAQEPPPPQDQQQAPDQQRQEEQSFESMLEQVKAKQENKEVNFKRTEGKYDPARTPGYKDW